MLGRWETVPEKTAPGRGQSGLSRRGKKQGVKDGSSERGEPGFFSLELVCQRGAINRLVFLEELRMARLDSRFKQAQASHLCSQVVTKAWGVSLQICCT